MSGLRGLVEKATPGPWEFDGFEHVVSLEVADIVCGLWQGIRAEGVPTPDMEADAALIVLAPDLALWAADAADALQNWKGQNHGFTRRGKPRRGCNLKTIHGCQPCRLLARFAVIEHTAQEDTP